MDFNYNNPFIKFLETIANLLIISFFTLLGCIPIVTAVTAFSAGYYTLIRVVYGPSKGRGVSKGFFNAFKDNLKLGIKLNLVLLVAIFFLVVGVYAGWQIYKTGILGTVYFAFGILLSIIFVAAVTYIPPVLAHFEGSVLSIIRLSLYFSSQRLFVSLFNGALLIFLIWSIEIFPLALLIVPGLYLDLIRPGIEKEIAKFLKEYNIEEDNQKVEISTEEDEVPEELSSVDIDKKFSDQRKKNRRK